MTVYDCDKFTSVPLFKRFSTFRTNQPIYKVNGAESFLWHILHTHLRTHSLNLRYTGLYGIARAVFLQEFPSSSTFLCACVSVVE